MNDVSQVWYVDDVSGAGKVHRLRDWWDQINTLGPKFGYFTNARKTWLVTKEDYLSAASAAFADTGVKVTSEGRPYLGAALGTEEYVQTFATDKVQQWAGELEQLATIAHSQPHAAHAAFTHGMTSKWTYLTRTMPDFGPSLLPLDTIIRTKLIPALTGRPPPNNMERDLLALPARLGGIALANPTHATDLEFQCSTEALTEAILRQEFQYTEEVIAHQLEAKRELQKLRRDLATQTSEQLKKSLPHSLQRSIDLAQEKGASSWLTSLPIAEFGFTLHKGAFHNALALRYNWQPLQAPSTCECGAKFSVEHALSCPKGGFPSLRHNEIRDLTANLLTEVCSDVCIEPELQPLTGEVLTGATSNVQDGARLDIAINTFWEGQSERTFLEVLDVSGSTCPL